MATEATIGHRVEAARKALGLSQTALGKAVGVSQPVISKIEGGGKATIDAQLLHRIAEALGVSIGALHGTEDLTVRGRAVSQVPEQTSTSGQRSRLPPGLAGFLERHEKRLDIKRRERWYLEHDRTETEQWLVKDDAHWERRLKFWREELKHQDAARGEDSSEDTE